MASTHSVTTNSGLTIIEGDIYEKKSPRKVNVWYPFRFSFKSWVEDNIATGDEEKRKRVGSDYASRMGRLCGARLCNEVKPYLQMLPSLLASNEDNRKTALRLLDVYQHLAYEEKEKIRDNKEHLTDCKNTDDISSLNTALFAYSIFIADLLAEKDFHKLRAGLKKFGIEPDQKRIEELESFVLSYPDLSITFSRAELKKIFKNRLLTQDRLEGNYKVYFPIRLINTALHEYGNETQVKDGAIRWAEEVIDGIVCLTGADAEKDIVPFKNITKLTIKKDRTVEICYSNKNIPLYSELHDETFGKMTDIEAIKDVAIDHIVPIFNLLQNEENYPSLKTLTETYRSMTDGDSIKPKDVLVKLTEVLKGKGQDKAVFAGMLLEDLWKFNDNNYRLMSQKENVQKGKGVQ